MGGLGEVERLTVGADVQADSVVYGPVPVSDEEIEAFWERWEAAPLPVKGRAMQWLELCRHGARLARPEHFKPVEPQLAAIAELGRAADAERRRRKLIIDGPGALVLTPPRQLTAAMAFQIADALTERAYEMRAEAYLGSDVALAALRLALDTAGAQS